jgi:hypothetical protein
MAIRWRFHLLDWDNLGRVQSVDARSDGHDRPRHAHGLRIPAGQYLVWQVTGHVKIRITRLAGSNAVVSGVFVD